MTEEPVYNYVKGKGWIPGNGYSLTSMIGKWEVTLEQRRPMLKERFVEMYDEPDYTVERMMEILKGDGYNYAFNSLYARDYFNQWRRYNERRDYANDALFVIKIQKQKAERKPRATRARVRAVEAVTPVTQPNIEDLIGAIGTTAPRRSRRRPRGR